jgi:hypothetical protein
MIMEPEMKTAAICGLFCPSCAIFIATKDDPARLKALAAARNQSVEETRCEGCRTDCRTKYCDSCVMAECAMKKGLEFCSECAEYPCADLKEFQSLRPHRLELWQSLALVKEQGFENWYRQMTAEYSCPECATLLPGMRHPQLGLRYGLSQMRTHAELRLCREKQARDPGASEQDEKAGSK